MFTNKGFFWKFWLALAAIALLGVHAARGGLSINPAVWQALSEPDRWEGTPIWCIGEVVSSNENGAMLRSGPREIAVRGRLEAPAGASVEVSGIFRREGPHLELLDWRRSTPGSHRWILEAVSLLVLLGVGWNFVRHFAVRPEMLRVEGAD